MCLRDVPDIRAEPHGGLTQVDGLTAQPQPGIWRVPLQMTAQCVDMCGISLDGRGDVDTATGVAQQPARCVLDELLQVMEALPPSLCSNGSSASRMLPQARPRA